MLQPFEIWYAYFVAKIDCTVKILKKSEKTAYLRLIFRCIPFKYNNA